MSKKSNSLIRNNLRGRRPISVCEQVAQDRERKTTENGLVFDGLVCALKRTDPNWQEWMNTCSSYPSRVYFSRFDEMEKIFKMIHKRICDVIFLDEYEDDLADHYDDLADYRTCQHYGIQL